MSPLGLHLRNSGSNKRVITFRGKRITDIDGIGARGSDLLLISAKSIRYNDELSVGDYRAVRNASPVTNWCPSAMQHYAETCGFMRVLLFARIGTARRAISFLLNLFPVEPGAFAMRRPRVRSSRRPPTFARMYRTELRLASQPSRDSTSRPAAISSNNSHSRKGHASFVPHMFMRRAVDETHASALTSALHRVGRTPAPPL